MISWPSGPQLSGFRSAGVVLLAVAVVAGTWYFGKAIRAPLTASQLEAVASPTPFPVARETVYPEPRPVEWIGIVDGVFLGGDGLFMRRTDTSEPFQAYLREPLPASASTDGLFRVVGNLTGVTCAYARAAQDGGCVPYLEDASLEPIPIELM